MWKEVQRSQKKSCPVTLSDKSSHVRHSRLSIQGIHPLCYFVEFSTLPVEGIGAIFLFAVD